MALPYSIAYKISVSTTFLCGRSVTSLVCSSKQRHNPFMSRAIATLALIFSAMIFSSSAPAVILWSEPDAGIVHDTGSGVDILNGKVRRTGTNTDALYFKFHVDPLSDAGSEPYYAGLQLFEGNQGRLGVGNAGEAWGYSAFNTSEMGPSNQMSGKFNDDYEFNLQSSHPEPGTTPGTCAMMWSGLLSSKSSMSPAPMTW
jgi:hypothetical protein